MFQAMLAICRDAIGHFNGDDGWALASHVALSILLAMFPFLIFVTAVAGFAGSPELAAEAAHLLFEAWPPEVAAPVAREIETLVTVPRFDLLTIGILLAVFLASNGVEAVRTALNRAYRVQETRPFYLLRLQSVTFVVLGAIGLILIALAAIVAPVIWYMALEELPALSQLTGALTRYRLAIAVIILAIGLIMSHRFLPARRQTFGLIWPGVVFTITLWIIGGILFGIYIRDVASYGSTYAGLAGIMTSIVFLYLVGVVMILGAELNAAIARFRNGDLAEQVEPVT
ncbi:MAG: YihY/virulence factor BrkB family protein [Pseudomonadota bacterium]